LFLNEWNFYMILPMSILSICSIFVGYLFYDSFLGIGSMFWGNSIYINLLNYSILDAEFSLFLIKFMPLIITLLGILSFFIINKFLWDFFFYYFFKNNYIWFIYYFFNKALFFDYIINNVFLNYLLKLSYFYVYKYIEKGVFEFFGPILIYIFFSKIYNELKFLNSGLIYNYIFLILWSMIIFIILFEFIFLFNIGLILIFIFGFFFIFKIKNMDYLGNQR
jgi:NADH-ubiquinone oxidoreductase chain 5